MGLLIIILLGALVGYIAARLFGRREGFLASLVIGVLGAIIGSWISHIANNGSNGSIATNPSYLAFHWVTLLWALVGSVVVVIILNMIQNRSNTPRIP